MAFLVDSADRSAEPALLCDINTTPLIDVMLVLLIMLIVTIPIQLHAIDLSTPAVRTPPAVPPATVRIDIDAASHIRWQGEPVETAADLEARLQAVAAEPVAPLLQLRPDAGAHYAAVVQVLAATRRHGIGHVAMLGGEQFE